MTTKARIAALQWFHDRGEASEPEAIVVIGMPMIRRMRNDGQLSWYNRDGFLIRFARLTDKGRQDLHEATK